MFHKFTEKAIMVIMLAQEESRRVGHNRVGTEQILLGLIRVPSGSVAGNVLASSGLALNNARQEIEKIIGKGSGIVEVEIPFTPNAKKLMESAWEIAQIHQHNYIGTEHLLAGLLETRNGVALQVLERLDINVAGVEDELEKNFGPPSSESGALTGNELELVRLKVNIHIWRRKADIARAEGPNEAVDKALKRMQYYEEGLVALEKRVRENETG